MSDAPVRPFKIHDEKKHVDLPWRCYKTAERAIEKCLVLLLWLEVGNTYTVYDVRNSKAVLQVTRKISGLVYFEETPGMVKQISQQINQR